MIQDLVHCASELLISVFNSRPSSLEKQPRLSIYCSMHLIQNCFEYVNMLRKTVTNVLPVVGPFFVFLFVKCDILDVF